MTEVAFHFNMPDRMAYLCRLLRKASGQGARVAVVGETAGLQELDQALWAISDVEFVPHCFADDDPVVRDATAVILGGEPAEAPHHEVLVNLGAGVPIGFERFDRLIEVVGDLPDERAQSRTRWKYYQSRGYPIVRHDLGATKEMN